MRNFPNEKIMIYKKLVSVSFIQENKTEMEYLSILYRRKCVQLVNNSVVMVLFRLMNHWTFQKRFSEVFRRVCYIMRKYTIIKKFRETVPVCN